MKQIQYITKEINFLGKSLPIKLHNQSAFESMTKAGALASSCLDYITPYVIPGVTTDELNRLCHDFIWMMASGFCRGGSSGSRACCKPLRYAE